MNTGFTLKLLGKILRIRILWDVLTIVRLFLQVCLFVSRQVSFFVVIKPENPYFASRSELKVKPLGVTVNPLEPRSSSFGLTKGTPLPETLYMPTEVNTTQVCIPARTYVSPGRSRILSHRIAFRDPPRLIPLSTNTQGSLVPQVPTLKGVRVR